MPPHNWRRFSLYGWQAQLSLDLEACGESRRRRLRPGRGAACARRGCVRPSCAFWQASSASGSRCSVRRRWWRSAFSPSVPRSTSGSASSRTGATRSSASKCAGLSMYMSNRIPTNKISMTKLRSTQKSVYCQIQRKRPKREAHH